MKRREFTDSQRADPLHVEKHANLNHLKITDPREQLLCLLQGRDGKLADARKRT